MESISETKEFHPELISRRGELIAWLLTLLVGATWLVLYLSGHPASRPIPILAFLLLLSGAGISLSNWMDRHTVLRVDPDGIAFQNGLRRAHLHWDEIRQVQVYPSSWGDKVRVIGPDSAFDFRTLGEVAVQGEVKGRMGFREGKQILQRILDASHLKQTERTLAGGYYYERE